MPALSDDDIRAGLAELDGWELAGGQITRQFKLGNFRDTVAFVVRVSYEAEAAAHHPDVEINYDRVRFTLSTHSEGGVTAKDFDLAAAIERLARSAGA